MMTQENNLNRIIAQERQYIIQQQASTSDSQRESQRQLIPVNFVALESCQGNNYGSTERFNKPGYERYLLFNRDESYYLDINFDLMERLGLTPNEDSPYSFYVAKEVLTRRQTRGGITIDNAEEIIIVKPNQLLEREVQTDLTAEQVVELEDNLVNQVRNTNTLQEEINTLRNNTQILIQERDASRDRINEANDTINNLQTNLTTEQEAHQNTQIQSVILQAAIVVLQNQVNNLTIERNNLTASRNNFRNRYLNTHGVINNAQVSLGVDDLNNLPILPHGENLNSLLERPTREQLQNEQDIHQQTQNQLINANNIINTTQNCLEVNNLIQLPVIPQRQSLQSLIDFYNNTPQDWQQQINNAHQERDDVVNNYNNLMNERNDLKEKNENLNKVLTIHRANAAWYDTGEADFTQGIDQEYFFKNEMPNLVYLRIKFDENYAARFVPGKDIDINSNKGLQQVNFEVVDSYDKRTQMITYRKNILYDLKMKIKAPLIRVSTNFFCPLGTKLHHPLIEWLPLGATNQKIYQSLPVGIIEKKRYYGKYSASEPYPERVGRSFFLFSTEKGCIKNSYYEDVLGEIKDPNFPPYNYKGAFPLSACSWLDPNRFGRIDYVEENGKMKIVYS